MRTCSMPSCGGWPLLEVDVGRRRRGSAPTKRRLAPPGCASRAGSARVTVSNSSSKNSSVATAPRGSAAPSSSRSSRSCERSRPAGRSERGTSPPGTVSPTDARLCSTRSLGSESASAASASAASADGPEGGGRRRTRRVRSAARRSRDRARPGVRRARSRPGDGGRSSRRRNYDIRCWCRARNPGAPLGWRSLRVHQARRQRKDSTCPTAPHAGIARKATRLAALRVSPRGRGGGRRDPRGRGRGVGRLRRQGGGLALVARRNDEGAPGDARGERRRRHGELARRRAVRRRADRGGAQQAGPDIELLVVQDLGAERDLDRRGTAQRPERVDLVRLSARLRHHRGRDAPRLRLLELERLLPDHVRSRDLRPAGDQQRAQPDRHQQPDAPVALRLADHLARGLVRRRRSSTSRTRAAATPTRTPSPRGSTPRTSGSSSKASTSRRTGAWWRSGSRRGTAARRPIGEVGVLAIQGVDQAPASLPAVDCSLPAAGIATRRVARPGRRDDRVEGRRRRERSPAARRPRPIPCVMGSAPVVLSPTGEHPSIGGADVAAFLPRPPAAAPPVAGSWPRAAAAPRTPRAPP